MNKTAIKEFAIEARKKLIASVKDKAGKIGITVDSITESITTGNGFAVFPTHFGTETTLTGKELIQRDTLIKQIREKGYDVVMEEVAYTWFNRIIAVRFMEVNDYLPSKVRVLSSEKKDQLEPDIVTQAPDIELNLTEAEKEMIFQLKLKNEMDSLFQMLFIKQCNALGEILPELFENTPKNDKDYTEILLDISYTNEDSVIRDLLKIEETDFLDAVEIIGWMYQYYNTEPKDETFALLKKNVKITKERIPSVTQLFTPDWIVRYMVENSLGRLWLEGHENADLKANWKYYLDEAEQEPEVLAQLETLRTDAKNLNPEDIKIIDPCMGSGHILVYAFEVLMQIYKSVGYTEKDAARLIIEKNLYGLDIDDRAFQLAYFAVMMKGRKYNRRILKLGLKTKLCGIQESNTIKPEVAGFIANGDSALQKNVESILDVFIDAKEYGSILDVQLLGFALLNKRVKEIEETVYDNIMDRIHRDDVMNQFAPLLKQAEIMARKYDIVITNPPYMGSSGMGMKLGNYVKKYYPDSKIDMFAVFIVKCKNLTKAKGYYSLITQPSVLFLSSYEKLRKSIIFKQTISSLLHMGRGIFGIDFGSTAFVIKNGNIKNYKGSYFRLHERTFQYIDPDDIAKLYLLAKGNSNFKFNFATYQTNNELVENAGFKVSNKELRIYYETNQEKFEKIPRMPISYWISDNVYDLFDKTLISKNFIPKFGMSVGDGERFTRFWYEANYTDIAFDCFTEDEFDKFNKKWCIADKGGSYRRWYGNKNSIIWWKNNGSDIRLHHKSAVRSPQLFFKPHISWTLVSSRQFSARIFNNGYLLDTASNCIYFNDDKINLDVLGYLNSKVASSILRVLNPTINMSCGVIGNLPYLKQENKLVDVLVKNNIEFSKKDWNSFETSWDFKKHPLIQKYSKISNCFSEWETFSLQQFTQLKANEEELNRIFIEIYGLEDELTPEVEDKDVTIRKAALGRDIRSLISYAVGCMLGRYSLDVEGLSYAGGEWDTSKYNTIIPDKDNIIPITDEEYFDDDMVARLVNFVKVVYGEDTLEENLDFIANALGNKGNTTREAIRNYFLKDFYKDHVKIYQKRPIYWLFDSGKENGFKALIYMHRYNEDTVGRVRTDYLHKVQAKLEDVINQCNMVLSSDASAVDKATALKKKEKLVKQLAETKIYDQAIAHIALQRIPIDLDDGVKVNYAKFQDVEVSSEGKKSVKVNLLSKI